MHRILVDPSVLAAEVPELPQAATRHLKVVRVRSGETVELFDGRGNWRDYVFAGAGLRASAPLKHLERSARSLTLFACVTKGSRWDWTIEKATELGVTRIVPVISARTIVRIGDSERAAKRERWQRIAEDAARQSDAKWLPEIVEPLDFAASLELVAATRCFVGALVEPKPEPLAAAVGRSAITDALAVYVGPEGDFTPEELKALLAIATPTTFGSTILRAETAAIFALSVVKAFADNQKK